VDSLEPLRRLLRDSSDPENPSPEELSSLFERIRRIAVVGISRDPAKAARRVPSYLAAKGYDIVPVNPSAGRILGQAAFAKLSDVADPVDMVLIFRPSDEAAPLVREAAARPEHPAVWLQEGIRADEEARQARSAGVIVVQDLCTYKAHRALTT